MEVEGRICANVWDYAESKGLLPRMIPAERNAVIRAQGHAEKVYADTGNDIEATLAGYRRIDLAARRLKVSQ